MTNDELREIGERAAAEIASERYRVRELVVALRAAQARVAELEAEVLSAQILTDMAIEYGVECMDGIRPGLTTRTVSDLLDEANKYYIACRAEWDKEQVTP